mgnify:CR=1 FL=1
MSKHQCKNKSSMTKKEKIATRTNIKNKEGIEKDIYSVYAIINNRQ